MLTVVCKATYVLTPGESPLATAQDEPNEADGYWNDEETRSLNFSSDLAPFKRRADVLVVGHAFAPERRPVGSLVARVVVGEVDKAIAVFGDRTWTASGAPREPARFVKMPLRWERAAGGPRTTNPVGVRMGDTEADQSGMTGLPNLQPTGAYLVSPADVLQPVGFGPIAPRWPGRMEKLHRHGMGWDPARWTERPLPDDVDAAFFNVAPEDQQLGEIRGDERLMLENLHADHARLVTRLAPVEPRAVVVRAAGSAVVRLRCDTLWIDTDRGVCSLVWRGQVMLARPDEAGQVTIGAEDSRKDEGVETIVGGMMGSAPLPFGSGSVANGDADKTLPVVMNAASSAPSFRERSPWAAPLTVAHTPQRSDDDGTGTIVGSAMLGQVLPFPEASKRLVEVAPIPPPPAIRPPSFASSEPTPERYSAPAIISSVTPAPPAMIGPLMRMGGPAGEGPPQAQGPEPEALSASDENIQSIASEPDSTVALHEPIQPEVELSIERFAAISAEIVEARVARAEVLHNHDVTHRAWLANERRWIKAIEDEAADGSSTLQRASDRAYVEAVEGFRGPVALAEYAQIVVGLERGRANQVLDKLAIQRPALMPILRVWTKKVASEEILANEATMLLARIRGS